MTNYQRTYSIGRGGKRGFGILPQDRVPGRRNHYTLFGCTRKASTARRQPRRAVGDTASHDPRWSLHNRSALRLSGAVDLARATEERVVVATLPVLGLVEMAEPSISTSPIDRSAGSSSCRQRFVEAELDKREEGQFLGFLGLVPDRDLPHLEVFLRRHKHQLLHLDAGLAARDAGIAQAVAAFKSVERSSRRPSSRDSRWSCLLHIEKRPSYPLGCIVAVARSGGAGGRPSRKHNRRRFGC